MQPISMAHMAQQKSGGKRGKGCKGCTPKKAKPATPATQQPPQQAHHPDIPRQMCRAYYVDDQCPRWAEHGFCPYQHFNPDQITMGTNGYWKPKPGARPGLTGSTFQGFHAEPRGDPEGEDPEWAWETGSVGSQQSARSARSARSAASQRSALATAVSLL